MGVPISTTQWIWRRSHTLVCPFIVVPEDRNAMRGVLTGEPEQPRDPLWPNVLKANQADTRDGVAIVKLRAERRRKGTLDNCRIYAEIHQ